MHHAFTQYLYSVLRQATQEIRQMSGTLAQALLRTPLPRIVVIAAALALAISLIPFIISLFILLVLFRLFLGMLRNSTGQDRGHDMHYRQIPIVIMNRNDRGNNDRRDGRHYENN